MQKINWDELPYSHKYEKSLPSILNPSGKISLPELIVEMVLLNREKVIKGYRLQRGAGWSTPIGSQVRRMIMQAIALCNYFEDYKVEPLVFVAIKNHISKNCVLKIGGFKKYRVTKTGKSTISQDEKDFVKGVFFELDSLKNKRSELARAIEENVFNQIKTPVQQMFDKTPKKNRFEHLVEMEKKNG